MPVALHVPCTLSPARRHFGWHLSRRCSRSHSWSPSSPCFRLFETVTCPWPWDVREISVIDGQTREKEHGENIRS